MTYPTENELNERTVTEKMNCKLKFKSLLHSTCSFMSIS